MLSRIVPALGGLSITSQASSLQLPSRPASSHSRAKRIPPDDDEMADARKWLKDFSLETILDRLSKGVSIKAGAGMMKWSKYQQRTPLAELLPLIPKPLHEAIREHRYYSSSSKEVVITSSDGPRKHGGGRGANKEECSKKLYLMLREIGERVIPAERSYVEKPESIVSAIPYSKQKSMKESEMKRYMDRLRAAQQSEKRRALEESKRKENK